MQEPVVPLSLVRSRPIGMLVMVDQGLDDEKVVCVNLDDPEYRTYAHVAELPPHRLAELRRFFEDYKQLEGKEVRVEEQLLGPDAAKRTVTAALARYDEEHAR
jgi:inorganic pyrophosphatase